MGQGSRGACSGEKVPKGCAAGRRIPRSVQWVKDPKGCATGQGPPGPCNGSRTPRAVQWDTDPKGCAMGHRSQGLCHGTRIPRDVRCGEGSPSAWQWDKDPKVLFLPSTVLPAGQAAEHVGSPTATGQASSLVRRFPPTSTFQGKQETNLPIRASRGEGHPLTGKKLPGAVGQHGGDVSGMLQGTSNPPPSPPPPKKGGYLG